MKSLLICLLAVISLKRSNCQVEDGAVKIILTKKGLDYAAWLAVEMIAKKVQEANIEDVSGKADVKVGKVSYEFTNTKITNFVKPTANVVVNNGQGLTLSLSGADVSATGNWFYRYRLKFIRKSDKGSFTASAEGVSISVAVYLGRNQNGAPTIASSGCQCSINDVDINIRGGASWLYRIFIKFYKNKIKSSFEKMLCKEAQNVINNNGAEELATLNMQARINSLLEINYGLSTAPIYANDFMESNHVGRFLNDDVVENAPAMQASYDHMVSVSLSDVLLNSGIRILFKNNKFQFVKELTESSFLNEVIGAISGDETAPTATGTRIYVGAVSPPIVTIKPGNFLINAEVEGKIEILQSDGTALKVIDIKVTIQLNLQASIQSNKLMGKVARIKFGVKESATAEEKKSKLITTVINLLLPSINEALSEGFPLPNLDGLQFQDSVLFLNERHITVATNAAYVG